MNPDITEASATTNGQPPLTTFAGLPAEDTEGAEELIRRGEASR